MAGLFGEDIASQQLEGGSLDPTTAAALANTFGAYTGAHLLPLSHERCA